MSLFARKLTALMAAHEIDLAELSRRTEIPYHRADPWFRRPNAKPNGPDLQTLAEFFHVPPKYLISASAAPDLPKDDDPLDFVVMKFARMSEAAKLAVADFARTFPDAKPASTPKQPANPGAEGDEQSS